LSLRDQSDRILGELRRLSDTETDFFGGEEMIRVILPGAEPTPPEPRHVH
jgi:hypothetical protein